MALAGGSHDVAAPKGRKQTAFLVQEFQLVGADGGPRWYVVRTHARREAGAEAQLRRQGFLAFLPRVDATRRRGSQFRTSPAPLFPRYLFVRFDAARDRWRSINGTIGVASLLSMGERPQPVPTGLVEALIGREASGVAAGFAVRGDVVRVIAGPFTGMVGRIETEQPAGRVRILMDILGGEVPLAVDGRCLARAA